MFWISSFSEYMSTEKILHCSAGQLPRAEHTAQDHRTGYKAGTLQNLGAICDKAENPVLFIEGKSKIQSPMSEMLMYIKLFHFKSRLEARLLKELFKGHHSCSLLDYKKFILRDQHYLH